MELSIIVLSYFLCDKKMPTTKTSPADDSVKAAINGQHRSLTLLRCFGEVIPSTGCKVLLRSSTAYCNLDSYERVLVYVCVCVCMQGVHVGGRLMRIRNTYVVNSWLPYKGPTHTHNNHPGVIFLLHSHQASSHKWKRSFAASVSIHVKSTKALHIG